MIASWGSVGSRFFLCAWKRTEMAITFACECGNEFSVAPEKASVLTKCPACGKRATMSSGKSEASTGPATAGEAAADPGKELASGKRPKPFVAVYSTMARTLVHRGYAFPDAVLLLEFAGFNIFTGYEVAREGKSKHLLVNVLAGVKGIFGALAGAAVFTVAAVLVRLVVRMAGKDLDNAADMLGGLIFLVGLALCLFVLAVFSVTFQARRRARQIDAMTDDELRAEVEANKKSVAITRDEVKKALIDPPPKNDFGKNFVAELRFETEAGKWNFLLPTKKDAKAAAKGLRNVLGEKRVVATVDFL